MNIDQWFFDCDPGPMPPAQFVETVPHPLVLDASQDVERTQVDKWLSATLIA